MKKLICKIGVIAMLISGCTKKEDAHNSQLNIHFIPVTLGLDPHKMEDAYSMTVVTQIHRGLLRYAPSGDIAPDLADKWLVSSDHKKYTFTLKNSFFSDGAAITTNHVQMSFARLFFLGSAMGADLDYIEGAKEFIKSGDIGKLGIKINSPTEIEFRLEHPSALFLKHLATADCAILPLKSFKDEIKFDEKTPYAGPYKVVAQEKDSGVTIEKWRKDALEANHPPETIRFFLSEAAPAELAITGKTDSLDHDPVSAEDFKKLISSGWKETATELIAETYLIMNPGKVSQDVREAIFSAIDPKHVAELLGPKYVPAFGAIPRGLPGELTEGDIKHLRIGKSVKAAINLEYDPKSAIHEKIVPYIKKKLGAAGIQVNLVPLAKRELLKKIFSSDCEVCLGNKGLDYPDGYSVLAYFKSEYPSNFFYVKDKSVDALVNESGKILEKNKRENQYREIQKKILAHYTLVPLAFGSQASGLWSKKIEKVPPHVMGYHMLPFETIEMRAK